LLSNADPDDPLMPDIAKLYLADRAAFDEKAKEWT